MAHAVMSVIQNSASWIIQYLLQQHFTTECLVSSSIMVDEPGHASFSYGCRFSQLTKTEIFKEGIDHVWCLQV